MLLSVSQKVDKVDKRVDKVDKRVDKVDKRVDEVDKRVDEVDISHSLKCLNSIWAAIINFINLFINLINLLRHPQ